MKGARRSLNDLLGWKPMEPPYPTSLVERCAKACATGLEDLDTEQIRLLVGQGIGLEHVLPLAFEILGENPLIEVTFYPGDLLKACLKVDPEFWAANEDLWEWLNSILYRLDNALEDLKPHRTTFMQYVGAS